MKTLRNERGFTLVELMLVVVILGTLAAMIVPRFAGRSEEAKKGAAKADIEANLANALDMYELDNGQFPTTEQGLAALTQAPSSQPAPKNWKGPYIKRGKFQDPWGNAYQYRFPGTHSKDYDLYSWGPNGAEGGGDDVTNWESTGS
jgi:general secretion pathway protein G